MRGYRWFGLFSVLIWPLLGTATDTEQVRPAAVAGSWYPGTAAELGPYLDGLLDARPSPATGGRVRALILPHAGFMYSGAAAADGVRLVRGASYRRVLVLGPAHRAAFPGLSIDAVTHYETPLGPIPLDGEAVASLRQSQQVQAHPEAGRREHAIEMQLPLLQRALVPGWRLVPVLVGDLDDAGAARAAELLRPLVDDQTLVVVSSDFTHYGPRYGYVPFPQDERIAERIEALDRGALAKILANDPQGFSTYQRETGITICGQRPIAVLLHLLPAGIRPRLETYTSSGALTGDYRQSVSYLTVVFRDGAGPPEASTSAPQDLSRSDLERLHGLASRVVVAAVRPDEGARARLAQALDGLPPVLQQPAGAFVTLRQQGQLRGCIGYIQPSKPLAQAVRETAVSAALRDRRFPPVTAAELPGLELEVSVLTPPRPIGGSEEFRVGEQGIILEKDGRQAVFLPEVATEQGWDREQTLSHLARKAGLPADGWREGAKFQVFTSQKLSAPLEAP